MESFWGGRRAVTGDGLFVIDGVPRSASRVGRTTSSGTHEHSSGCCLSGRAIVASDFGCDTTPQKRTTASGVSEKRIARRSLAKRFVRRRFWRVSSLDVVARSFIQFHQQDTRRGLPSDLQQQGLISATFH